MIEPRRESLKSKGSKSPYGSPSIEITPLLVLRVRVDVIGGLSDADHDFPPVLPTRGSELLIELLLVSALIRSAKSRGMVT